jgi:hypothetical protein
MKIFNRFLDSKIFEEKLKDFKHIDFSLFLDDIPKSQDDLSELNIMVLAEPDEYFGLHEWTIKNQELFSAILTWDDKVINNCSNTIHLPFGYTWFLPDQYNKEHKKEFKISHLRGNLLKSYGHQMRWEILNRKNEIKIPTNFFEIYGDRSNLEDARLGKEIVFGDSQYGIAIENFSHRGFFTEKILDCFLLKTIPVYNGCSNIGDYFDINGIIMFNNVDDLIYTINNLNEEYYESKKESIEKNWKLAQQYIQFEQNVINTLSEIFKINNLS